MGLENFRGFEAAAGEGVAAFEVREQGTPLVIVSAAKAARSFLAFQVH